MDGLTVATDKFQYQIGEVVVISGMVHPVIPHEFVSMAIIEQASAPYVYEAVLIPDESGWYEFQLGDPFLVEGRYFIDTYYGDSFARAEFEIVATSYPDWPIEISIDNDEFYSVTTVGQQTVLATTLANGGDIQLPFVSLIEVRDNQDITVFLMLQSGTIYSNGLTEVDAVWLPELVGSYEIRTFAISDIDTPQILSGVATSSIVVSP